MVHVKLPVFLHFVVTTCKCYWIFPALWATTKMICIPISRKLGCAFPGKVGWVTRIVSAIWAKIHGFDSRKSATGAKNLDDYIVKLNTRYASYEYEDWEMDTKMTEMASLYMAARDKIITNLAGFVVDNDNPHPVQVQDHCQLRPVSDLKPEKLHMDDTPVDSGFPEILQS